MRASRSLPGHANARRRRFSKTIRAANRKQLWFRRLWFTHIFVPSTTIDIGGSTVCQPVPQRKPSDNMTIFERDLLWTTRKRRASFVVGTLALLSLIGGTVEVHGQTQCRDFAPPAILRGKKFFNSVTGEYIPIKGIDYYPRPNAGTLAQTNSIDFFTDEYRSLWEADIALFQELNINVVRVYAVQPGVSHDGFMCALRAAGIYLIVGLAADCENCAITRYASPGCYPAELKERGQFIIAEFARYDNVLAFSAGNEAGLSAVSPLVNAPCQKQFLRDMRAYIDGCSETMRRIPVGLAIEDVDRGDKVLWYK